MQQAEKREQLQLRMLWRMEEMWSEVTVGIRNETDECRASVGDTNISGLRRRW